MADKVWLPDASQGFLLGKIVEFADEGPVVQPVDRYNHTVFTEFVMM